MFRAGPNGLVEARNKVAAYFLDKTDADWLWSVDADMGFLPDTVDRLVNAAIGNDPEGGPEYPVVGALCFGVRETHPDGMGGWQVRPFPTLYDWAQDREGTFGFRIRREYQTNTLTQVAGTGSACLLIHRSVLEKIRSELGDVWFQPVAMTNGKPVSEDLSFCYRVGTAGFPIYVHTGIQTSHHKAFWVSEDLYWLFESLFRSPPPSDPPLEEPGEGPH